MPETIKNFRKTALTLLDDTVKFITGKEDEAKQIRGDFDRSEDYKNRQTDIITKELLAYLNKKNDLIAYLMQSAVTIKTLSYDRNALVPPGMTRMEYEQTLLSSYEIAKILHGVMTSEEYFALVDTFKDDPLAVRMFNNLHRNDKDIQTGNSPELPTPPLYALYELVEDSLEYISHMFDAMVVSLKSGEGAWSLESGIYLTRIEAALETLPDEV